MKKLIIFNLLIIFLISATSCKKKEVKEPDRMDWWREARFGLFIHWGLYSIPAGEWKGRTDHAEWIRESAQIPLEQYDEFVSQFNPVNFNADEWVAMAKNAGMKYIVITSKHHDGFCLFDSKETDFDVMSTPFKRDILKELSDACAKQGITLCFYHSIMDWHHPDYLPRRNWETSRPAEGANMDSYVSHMKKQLKELLTNYGKIGVIWFDGEWEDTWTHDRGKDLYNYLRKLSPDLIINNRVDKGRSGMAGLTKDSTYFGDFGTPEQEIPLTGLPGVDWESCMTVNDHWGYNKNDQNWKSSEDLVHKLIDIASKGGNFLLNVGPTSEGVIPQASVDRLKDMGDWMKENGEAIYETQVSPFEKLDWGRCTQKEDGKNTVLYLHVFDWPNDGKLVIPGLQNKVVEAYALKDKSKAELDVEKTDDKTITVDVNNVDQSKYATVIVLEIKGKPVVKK
ncbi:MAG: alpha-L-fucosidase [Prolixibacteraceae bacterium]|nr:alpha-L-fucosidase [Prolixibacteraceae bacterium]